MQSNIVEDGRKANRQMVIIKQVSQTDTKSSQSNIVEDGRKASRQIVTIKQVSKKNWEIDAAEHSRRRSNMIQAIQRD